MMLRPEPGKKVAAGKICAHGAHCDPVWNGAQWYSHYDLSEAKATKLPYGSTQFRNAGKEIVFGAPGSPDTDLILAVNGQKEFGGVSPSGPSPWPHLYVEQELPNKPNLAELTAVPFRIRYRLLRHVAYRGLTWNERRHTAQFQFMLTLRNCNEASPGFGDYLWFIVPMYDARYRVGQPMQKKDQGNAKKKGTSKFIFSPGGEVFSKTAAVSGEWITIDHDLLPLMYEAIEDAWTAGFLSASHKVDDYHIASATMGWEVTGTWDVSMQVRDMGLFLSK
jgi:hypothetical protein